MTKSLNILAIALVALLFACGSKDDKSKSSTSTTTLKNTIDTVSYAIGVDFATNLKNEGFDSVVVKEMVLKGMEDILSGAKPLVAREEGLMKVQEYYTKWKQESATKIYGKNIQEGEKFLNENKTKAGVVTLPSGLQYQIIKDGKGAQPKATDMVSVHYKGTLMNGTAFDDSYSRNEPVKFQVGGVIQGWQEALQLMKVGSKWKLFVPYFLAYGERGFKTIEPYSLLIFEVELLGIEKPE